MNRLLCFSAVLLLQFGLSPAFADKALGFGSSATGGSGSPVVVKNFSDFKSAATAGGKIIHVDGVINGGDAVVTLKSNTTIIGLKNSMLTKMTIQIKNISNVVLRDLYIYDAKKGTCKDDESGGDLVQVESGTNIWMDHCEVANPAPNWPAGDAEKNCRDGLFDIKKASKDITISYSYFHDHWKGLLIGSSSSDAPSDRKVTIHHSYFRNMGSRIPSFRGGVLHFFNNYVKDAQISTINVREGALSKIEGSVFENCEAPISCQSGKDGYWDVNDNIMTGSKFKSGFEEEKISKTTKSCPISYSYSNVLMKASEVKAKILGMVGPTWKLSTYVSPTNNVKKIYKNLSSTNAALYNVRGVKISNSAPKVGGVYIIKDINGVHPVTTISK